MGNVTVKALFRGQTPDRKWRAEGEVFEIDASMVSKRWMEKVDTKPAPKPKAKPKAE